MSAPSFSTCRIQGLRFERGSCSDKTHQSKRLGEHDVRPQLQHLRTCLHVLLWLMVFITEQVPIMVDKLACW